MSRVTLDDVWKTAPVGYMRPYYCNPAREKDDPLRYIPRHVVEGRSLADGLDDLARRLIDANETMTRHAAAAEIVLIVRELDMANKPPPMSCGHHGSPGNG